MRVILPAGIVLFLTGLYHQMAFGSFFSTPYHHRFWFTHDLLAGMGVELGAFQAGAWLGMGLPSPSVALQLCFGLFKGIFVYSPILLVALAGHIAGLADRFGIMRRRTASGLAEGKPGRGSAGAVPLELADQGFAGAAERAVSERDPRSGRTGKLQALSLVVFGLYLAFNSALGSGLGEQAHHYWGGLAGLWGPRYLLAAVALLALGLACLDWSRRSVRLACIVALAFSCIVNILGALFARTLMSSFAFGSDLRFPPGHVLKLLLTEGPRVTILDAYGAPVLVQAIVLVALITLSAFLLRTSLNPPRA